MLHIKNIIKGWWWYFTKRPSKQAIERYKVCQACPYNEKGWCQVCGCYIPAKVLVPEEICHAGKWKDD